MLPLGGAAEAGLEEMHQRHADLPQSDAFDFHRTMAPAGSSPCLRRSLEPDHRQAAAKAAVNCSPMRLLDLPRALGFLAADVGRCHSARRCAPPRCAARARACEHALHALASDPPLGDAAVRGQAAVQMAGGGAVLVEHVAPHDGAQPLHVEVRVLDFERIEGPLHQLDAARQRVLALRQLQAPPDAEVAVLRQHAQHVAVQVVVARRA